MAQDFQFNFTNLNPVNSGWSTSSLAAKLKTAQDATAAKEAADAAQASVYGHVNGGSGTGGNPSVNPALTILGTVAGGPAGGVLASLGGGLLGGSDPRTPAEKLAHQTKMLAKQESKVTKSQSDVANAQHNIEALQAAIAKATDPHVIENLNKELEKEQKSAGKVQKKLDTFTSHTDEIKQKITGLGGTTGPAPVTTANYYNDLVDKSLASRTGVSGWHSLATGGTALVNPDEAQPSTNTNSTHIIDPNTGLKVPNPNYVYTPVGATLANPNNPGNMTGDVIAGNAFNWNKKLAKKAAKSGWNSPVPTIA